ncbi:hypothetical protein Tco_0373121 [Tanacetum coccineum]
MLIAKVHQYGYGSKSLVKCVRIGVPFGPKTREKTILKNASDDVSQFLRSLVPCTVDAKARRQGIDEVGYGIRDTWVDLAEAVPEIAPMTVGEDGRTRISQRVAMDSQRVDLLIGDRMTLQDDRLSQATHQELQTHRDHVYAHETHIQAHQAQLQLQSTLIQTQHQVYETRFQMQQAEMAALRESDRRRQAQMAETLRVMRDMRREMSEDIALPSSRAALTPQRSSRGEELTARDSDARIQITRSFWGSETSSAAKLYLMETHKSIIRHWDDRRNVQTARPCFYADFMKCQPLNYKGTEGVVSLTRWIKKMESVFNISGCAIENQVKFATCTLLGGCLTWGCQDKNLRSRAFSMTWKYSRRDDGQVLSAEGEL